MTSSTVVREQARTEPIARIPGSGGPGGKAVEAAAAVWQGLAAVGTGSADLGRLCDLLAELVAGQAAVYADLAQRPGRALAGILAALARLRDEPLAAEVLDRAPAELCATGVFDRVLVSGVRGSVWTPRRLFRSGGGDQQLYDFLTDLEIPLASPMVEAEIVRRRLPALVTDAQHEPRAFRALMAVSGTNEYVGAPVVAQGVVIGLLHADNQVSGRPLTTMDRDRLRIFAEGLGAIYERKLLESRLAGQREQLTEAFRAMETIFTAPEVLPSPVGTAVVATPAATTGDRPESGNPSQLTAREREVLALLASGATNAQVAAHLTVAESTVKSHVKSILHKLGVSNRAGAIARYLRAHNNERRI